MMKHNLRSLAFFIILAFPLNPQSKILSEDSKLIKVFDEAFFTEGPAFGPDSCIYFSDVTFTEETGMAAGNIWKHDCASGETALYRSPSGMSNGIEFNTMGEMITCEGADYGGRRITKTEIKSGKSRILVGLYNNKPLNSPNDLIIDKKGRIYFTDPRYAGWEEVGQECNGIYRIDTDGKIILLSCDIIMPNGIALSPDESKLYVGCNYEGGDEKYPEPESLIYTFDKYENGDLGNKRIFIKLKDNDFPDGLTIDKFGNLYVAIRNEESPGIYIYNPEGKLIETIKTLEVPSNSTFGKGDYKNILFITAGKSLYKIKILTEGI